MRKGHSFLQILFIVTFILVINLTAIYHLYPSEETQSFNNILLTQIDNNTVNTTNEKQSLALDFHKIQSQIQQIKKQITFGNNKPVNSLLQNLHSHTHITPKNSQRINALIDTRFLYPNPSFLKSTIVPYINPICKLLFPDYIYFFVSHKNGVYLMNDLKYMIYTYCNITKYKNVRYIDKSYGWLQSFNGSPYLVIRFQQEYKQFLSNGRSLKVIVQIRNPMDAIWSALNYHKKCTGAEPWEKYAPSNGTKFMNAGQLCCIVPAEIKQCSKRKQFVIPWNDKRWFKADDQLLNDEILSYKYNGNFFINRDDISYCTWLKFLDDDNNDKMAFYIEFIRYINCRLGKNGWRFWRQVYSTVHRWNFVGYFRLNDWIKDFDSNGNRMMDLINLIDNVENNKILRDNGLNVNIKDERKILLNLMQRGNVNVWSKSKLTSQRGEHVAVLEQTYLQKKKKVFDWILRYEHICIILKNITISLDFEWLYSQC